MLCITFFKPFIFRVDIVGNWHNKPLYVQWNWFGEYMFCETKQKKKLCKETSNGLVVTHARSFFFSFLVKLFFIDFQP